MTHGPMRSLLTIVVSGLGTVSTQSASGGLKLHKECGTAHCERYQYCNSDLICDSCSSICNVSSHNYERENCEHNCQDYIHDYISSYVNASVFAQLQGTVERMQSLVVVSLCLALVSIIVISGILFFVWIRYRRVWKFSDLRLKKKLASVNVINKMNQQPAQQNCNSTGGSNEGGLTLKMPSAASMMTLNSPSPSTVPPSNITTTTPITPISNRYPSEDATLEYAYDNPVLTPAPSPGTNLRRIETTF
ncbi:protein grindelwald [Nilaparvata lugens]|uniref:protein grindelwald n=1 Tax=Nilaparvata lugens TaxID=108931 RepID=UPI00193DFEAB|nr:protein grindelwald [Nilaparvata lugens]XP_039280472.1 protein grindelwald [Nilaparvata lugens]